MISPGVRAFVFERDEHKCQRCGTPDRLTIDHIVPLSRGGDDEPENLWVLCLSHNSEKGNRSDEKYLRPLGEGADGSLAAVAVAFSQRRRWELEAKSAVIAARDAGFSFADIARAAGISRQGARKLLT